MSQTETAANGTAETTSTDLKRRLGQLVEIGSARLTQLDERLARVSKEDWSLTGMRRQVKALRAKGLEARSAALKWLDGLPGEAIAAAAVAGRGQVRSLASSLKWVERRLDGTQPGRPAERR